MTMRGPSGRASRQALQDRRGHLLVGVGDGAPGLGGDDGKTAVRCLANPDVERNLAQEGDPQPGGLLPRTAVGEDFRAVSAGRAGEVAHVLDNPENGNVHLAEHVESLAGVDERQILWCGDDHGAGERRPLGERKLDIAGPRRQIDDHDVGLAPRHLAQHLFQGALHHRTAPHHGLVLSDQEADRHRRDAVGHLRIEQRPVSLGLARQSEEARRRRTVDVRVKENDLAAPGCQGQRQVGRGGRLADATLAAGHRHDGLDAIDAAGRLLRSGLVTMSGHDDAGREHAGQGANGVFGRLAHRLIRVTAISRHLHDESDVAVLDDEIGDEALVADRPAAPGIDDPAKGRFNCLSRDSCHCSPSFPHCRQHAGDI